MVAEEKWGEGRFQRQTNTVASAAMGSNPASP